MPRKFDPNEWARAGGLALEARRVVEGHLAGIHRSPFQGYCVEFAEHRQYYPGDEIRRIDWRAFGKTDRYLVKEHDDETNLKAMIVVDASGSMGYRGQQTLSKFEFAQRIGASLAYLLLSQLNAVGLLTHDDKPRAMVPPRMSFKHLMLLLKTLEHTKTGGETSLGAVWDRIAAKYLPRRGPVILLTDCFDNLDVLRRALRHLRSRRHEVILFQIVAPEELDFPFRNPTKFRNLENAGGDKLVDARRMREEYIRNFSAHTDSLRRSANDLQFDFRQYRTDERVEELLRKYLAGR